MAAPIVAAYADSLTQVFFWAVPVAVVGFVWAIFLREVPLRGIGNNRGDIGDAFAMPTSQSPDEMLEAAIGRLLRGAPGMRLRSIAMRPDCRLDVAQLWALLQIHRRSQVFGVARLSDIGDQFGLPYEVLQPAFDRIVNNGYAVRDVDDLWLAPSGMREVDFITTLIREWVVDKLTRSPSFEARSGPSPSRPRPDRPPHCGSAGLARGATRAGRSADPETSGAGAGGRRTISP
jgi:hypothetical protein